MQLLIGDLFRRNARATPNAAAASLGARVWTHAELDTESNRIGHALRAQGVGHGDRVACWADTSLEVVPLFAALAKLGAVFAPLNARYGVDELRPVAALARPRIFVADAERAERAETVARELEAPLFRLAGTEPGALPGASLAALAERASTGTLHEPALRESDPHVLFFTSGSTGLPKGVVLSHRANWLRGFQGVFRDEPERTACMFPLFHMAAFTLALAAWQTGGEIALCASAATDDVLATIERRRANRFYGIPAIWARLLETGFGGYDLTSLREADTGTSAVPPELLVALKQRLPHTVTRIYYGSTEAGAGTALPDRDALSKPGSVGPPVPGVELRLAGDGEVQLRSPFLMDGYFENDEATRAALDGGWYRTGDLGALDADGYLSIVGRLRDVIRSGGETIAPSEVEAAFADHADIAEIAIIGLPDPQWGEVVCAVAVARAGAQLTLDSLQAHAARKLARFKLPRRLELVDALPRTAATGQIQRALLVERIQSGWGSKAPAGP